VGHPVEILVKRAAIHGEGAIWDAAAQKLYWVDITGKTVFAFDPASGQNTSTFVGADVGTLVPRRSGGLMLALKDGFASLSPAGEVRMLAPVTADNPQVRFNDGKCDPAGRFWAGTMAYDHRKNGGKLYRLNADLSVDTILDPVSISNGIVWTRDLALMYYVDTPTREIAAFDYDNDTGQIRNRRVAVKVDDNLGHPDGMTIDDRDHLWVAMWGMGQICHFDPVAGRLVETIPIPGAKLISSCAFGGKNLDELYITTAAVDFKEEDFTQYPNSGSLLRVNVDARGVPSTPFAG
jgi:sugar lactone lactonase YvrE